MKINYDIKINNINRVSKYRISIHLSKLIKNRKGLRMLRGCCGELHLQGSIPDERIRSNETGSQIMSREGR